VRVYAVQAVLAEPPPFLPPLERPVVRTIAVREDQTLEQLHEALRLAFGWADAHLYSFWPSGRFWDDASAQYTAPFDLEERGENARSARIPLSELGLRKGRSLVYLFDFGDEWRLMLKVVETWTDDGDAAYPMLVEAEGVPPPQYTDDEDE
jgi:pRiA4b ORF-3-like protein